MSTEATDGAESPYPAVTKFTNLADVIIMGHTDELLALYKHGNYDPDGELLVKEIK